MAEVKVNLNQRTGEAFEESEKVVIQDKELILLIMTGVTESTIKCA